MRLIRLEKTKRLMTGMLAALLLIYSCTGVVVAEDEGECAHANTYVSQAVNATCTSGGYSGDTICSDCGAIVAQGSATAAVGHSWDSGKVVKAATCTEQGEDVYTCTVCAATKTEKKDALGHDYAIIEYVAPTKTKDGYEKFECTRCKDSYTNVLSKTGTGDGTPEFEYDDTSGATASSLTFYVGYFGMNFVKKVTLSLAEIQSACPMITQTFSYINLRPRVCYTVATGPRVVDVLELAEVDVDSAQSYLFATADSGGNYYNPNEMTHSSLFSTRFFYPNLSLYFKEDGTISDRTSAKKNASRVEPMLSIWDSWIAYGAEQEFDMSQHTSHMSSGTCFRLLYGQSQMDEVSAKDSAKWINTVYVRYTGKPSINAGNDMELSIGSDYTMSARVSTIDDTLTELFQSSVRWSSSDESVVKVDAKTGKITVVGEGTATITATAKVEGVSTSDSITVNVDGDADENLDGGGGTGGGNGSGIGDGTGDGTGNGDGTGGGDAAGDGDDSGNGENGDAAGKDEQADSTDEKTGDEKLENKDGDEEEVEDTEDIEVKIVDEDGKVSDNGKTIRVIPLSTGGGEDGEAGGKSGGGSMGDIYLEETDKTIWILTAAFAIAMLLAGGAGMYRKFKLEL